MITAMVFIDQPEVDVHVQDATQTSALHTCAEMSATPLRILRKSAAIIALQDQYLKTPLHYAAEQRSKSTTSLLITGQMQMPKMRQATLPYTWRLSNATPLFVVSFNVAETRIEHGLSPTNLQRAWKFAAQAGASFTMAVQCCARVATQTHLILDGTETPSTTIQRGWRTLARRHARGCNNGQTAPWPPTSNG